MRELKYSTVGENEYSTPKDMKKHNIGMVHLMVKNYQWMLIITLYI